MSDYVCNYSLLRFLPYRDAGEFVNIGVALSCGGMGFLDFRLELRRWARISHFFPEADIRTYHEGLRALNDEFGGWRFAASQLKAKPLEQREVMLRQVFGELARPREGIFHFGPARTILAVAPATTLDNLFEYYVRRRFVTEAIHSEEALRREVAQSLRNFELDRFYKSARVGTADYHIMLPFVAVEGHTPRQHDENSLGVLEQPPLKAIKPLDLDRCEPSEITQRGDEWVVRIRRLQALAQQPRHWLFVIREPQGTTRARQAADAVRRDLEQHQVLTATALDTPALIDFARLEPYAVQVLS